MFIFKYHYSASLSAGNGLSKLKRGEKLQIFSGVVTNTRIPNCIWNRPNLLANTSLCSDFSHCAILSQSLVQIGLIDCKFWEKTPQVHLIVIKERTKNNPRPILRNLDNFNPPGTFYSTLLYHLSLITGV